MMFGGMDGCRDGLMDVGVGVDGRLRPCGLDSGGFVFYWVLWKCGEGYETDSIVLYDVHVCACVLVLHVYPLLVLFVCPSTLFLRETDD